MRARWLVWLVPLLAGCMTPPVSQVASPTELPIQVTSAPPTPTRVLAPSIAATAATVMAAASPTPVFAAELTAEATRAAATRDAFNSEPSPTLPPTSVATIVPATAAPATTVATLPPTTAPTVAPAPTASPASTQAPVAANPAEPEGALLFLRGGDLWRHGVSSGTEQRIATQVSAFAPSADGAQVAVVREVEGQRDLWLVRADGGGLQRVTYDARSEDVPSWAADSSALVYASSAMQRPLTFDWMNWSNWCAQSEVRLYELANGAAPTLGAGCDPALAPDGKRVAFATPPQRSEGAGGAGNSIRLVNRQGQNGWDFAQAGSGENGLLVYAPAWSFDGATVSFQRFVGYQALTDVALTESAPAFKGGGDLLAVGAGWLRPLRQAPGIPLAAVAEHNYSDARGWGGYEPYAVRVLRLGERGVVALPEGSLPTEAVVVAQLPRAQRAAWQPSGDALALLLPTGWSAQVSNQQPAYGEEAPGEVRRWTANNGVGEVLVGSVDFDSPLAWVP